MTLSDEVAARFAEVADCLEFLGAERPTLDGLVVDWCDRQEADRAVGLVLDARKIARGCEAPPPVTRDKKRPAKRAKDRAVEAPVGEHVCSECGKRCASKAGLSAHRAASHASERFPCPDCDYVGTMKRALSRHRNQAHGTGAAAPPAAAAPEREPFVIPIPGFDGTHRLAHERRVGHQVDAYCACGDSSGPTDRDDARAWLHQHIEEAAA